MSVTASESWCNVKNADKRITVSVPYWGGEPNVDYSPRSCTVTIKAGTTFSKTVTVIQESDKANVSTGLYGEKVKISCAGETIKLPIDSNCISWNAKTDADWITLKVLDNATLQITATPRPDNVTSKRTATVVLTSDINYHVTESFGIEDTDPEVGSGNYGYDDGHSDWD